MARIMTRNFALLNTAEQAGFNSSSKNQRNRLLKKRCNAFPTYTLKHHQTTLHDDVAAPAGKRQCVCWNLTVFNIISNSRFHKSSFIEGVYALIKQKREPFPLKTYNLSPGWHYSLKAFFHDSLMLHKQNCFDGRADVSVLHCQQSRFDGRSRERTDTL